MTQTRTERTFHLWTYVVGWHDGDTWYATVDQGFHHYLGRMDKPVRCRAALIQAPELGDVGGQEALAYAQAVAPAGVWYPCRSYRPGPDGFGRPLLDLELPDGNLFSTVMMDTGHATRYSG